MKNLFFLPEVLTGAQTLALGILLVLALGSLLGLVWEASKAYGMVEPAYGGTLTEGITGKPRFINPLLAQTDADKDLVSLIYAGMLRYDGRGKLVPQLAKSYEISTDGLEYTVLLKEGLKWPDGEELTADDVLFTIQFAKNPLVQSLRRPNWEGVEVEKIDGHTIKFRLRRAYAPFLDNLTLGIMPKHIWEEIPPSQVPLVELNTNPVGAGPYAVIRVERDSVGSISNVSLAANHSYTEGRPNIKNIVLKFYNKEEETVESLKKGLIDSLGGISTKYAAGLKAGKYEIISSDLQRIIAAFFNKDAHTALSKKDIRLALNAAVNKDLLVKKILSGLGTTIEGPLPSGTPAESSYDPELARSLLEESELEEISFTVTTANNERLIATAEFLKKEWENIGVGVTIKTFPLEDLEQLVIGPRRYDVFVYGEEISGTNPDLFPFWHSSQRTHPGYNIALYANSKTDNLLESIRSEQSDKKRAELYGELQNEIKKDLPAVFLFSPKYIYAISPGLTGVDISNISSGSDRFSEVHKWYIAKKYVWKIFTN